MNDNSKDSSNRNELAFTFAGIGDRLKGISTDIQSRIKTQQEVVSDSGDYLESLKKAVDRNIQMANGNIPIPEENGSSPFPNFINNHLRETPDSARSVRQAIQRKEDGIKASSGMKQGKPENEVPSGPLLDRKKVKGLNDSLRTRVFGQDETISEVVDILKVAALKIKVNAKKPAGCYFFAGPSGVGKTELAQAIADQLGIPLLKINSGEYGLEHEVSKLIGAPPGYAGCDEDGVLTGFVKTKGPCVILFDEIEKAHASMDKILLSIMDHGECGTNKGETVSFTETIIIGTSNLGAEVEYIPNEKFLLDKEALEAFSVDYKKRFDSKATDEEIVKRYVQFKKNEFRMEYITEGLRPEIINRYDSIFHFNSLSPEIYGKVANKFLTQLSKAIETEHKFELAFSPKLVEWMVKRSYDPAMGGRPARKFIEKIVIKPLADYMLEDDFETSAKENKLITMDLNKDGNVCFKGKGKKILGVLTNTEELVSRIEAGKFS